MFIERIGEYVIDLVTGPVEDAGYRIYLDVWQSHRNERPIQAAKRRSRDKLVGVCETEQEARDEIERLLEAEAVRNFTRATRAVGPSLPAVAV